MEATAGPRCADKQAKKFIDSGFYTVIACGGDGTVHDVLQGLVGTDAALGVIPLGTANSLAADLGLLKNPAEAAAQLVTAQPTRISIGRIEYQRTPERRESRYFTVASGIGVDAALFYKLNAQFKQRYGMAAYVGESLRQWLVQKFHPFQVEWTDTEHNQKRTAVVTQLLVVRIADFGGVLNRLAPGADLMRNDFRLVLFKTASRARYLRFVTGRLLGRDWTDPNIELISAKQVSCSPMQNTGKPGRPAIYAEADGEPLGRLPVEVTIQSAAFNLLIPPKN